MEMTLKITIPVDVSREALATWVSGMLNVPVSKYARNEVETLIDPKELDLLDDMVDEVDVSWDDNALRPDAVYAKAVELWGLDFQAMMLAEECDELVAAMSQFLRRRVGAEKVIEEAADVYIMLAQVPHLLGGDAKAHIKAISKVVTDKKWRLENLVYGEVKP